MTVRLPRGALCRIHEFHHGSNCTKCMQGETAFVHGSADIAKTFDLACHLRVPHSLQRRGVHDAICAGFLRHMISILYNAHTCEDTATAEHQSWRSPLFAWGMAFFKVLLPDCLHPVWQQYVADALGAVLLDVAYCGCHHKKSRNKCNATSAPFVAWSDNLVVLAHTVGANEMARAQCSTDSAWLVSSRESHQAVGQ